MTAQKAINKMRTAARRHGASGHSVRAGSENATCYKCSWSAWIRREIQDGDLPGVYSWSVVIHQS